MAYTPRRINGKKQPISVQYSVGKPFTEPKSLRTAYLRTWPPGTDMQEYANVSGRDVIRIRANAAILLAGLGLHPKSSKK